MKDETVYGVMYRGNGYGPFFSFEEAKKHGEYIRERNEKTLGYGNRTGYQAKIQEFKLSEFPSK